MTDLPKQSASANESPAVTRTKRQVNTARWLEVIAAIMLGVVAVATAWSGYQGARWGGVQASSYTEASAKRVESTRAETLAGQDRLYDLSLFNEWLDANYHDEVGLASKYEARFRKEFRPAFAAWLAFDPFENSNAPPSPLLMAEYRLSQAAQADQLSVDATTAFERGKAAYEQSTAYVLNTVFLATVLLFITLAQRFEWTTIKVTVLSIALSMLLLTFACNSQIW